MGNTMSKAAALAIRSAAGLLFLALAGCSDVLLDAVKTNIEHYQEVEVPAAPTPNLPSGSHITGHETIVLTFAESMDPGTLALGGTIGAPNAPMWDMDSHPNDRVTLSRSAHWNAGSSRTLTVDCRNTAGTAMNTLTLAYTVFHGVCVAPSGLDTDEGTALKPRSTINAGIAKVQSEYGSGEVRVAKGTYSGASPVVTMVEGISLYGGYSGTSWGTRDFIAYESIIVDTSSTGGSELDPTCAVRCGASLTTSTVLDGFTLKVGGGEFSSAVFCAGSPTIHGCKIQGRTETDDAVHASGIESINSGPVISGNDINPGSAGGTGSWTCGVYLYNSTAMVEANTVTGGGTTSTDLFSCGIYSRALFSSPTITNNTIDGGSLQPEGYRYCIRVWNNHPTITDNTLHTTSAYGIYEQNAPPDSDPASVRRNDFYETSGTWYHETTGNVDYTNYDTAQVSTQEATSVLFDATWSNRSTGAGINP